MLCLLSYGHMVTGERADRIRTCNLSVECFCR